MILEEELLENYEKPTDINLLKRVETYLRENPNPANAPSTLFIKALTKNTRHCLEKAIAEEADLTMDKTVLLTAADYCKEGARRIQTGQYKQEGLARTEKGLQLMLAHLHSHAADFLEKASRPDFTPSIEEQTTLLEDAYSNLEITEEIENKWEDPSLASRLSFKGAIAYRLAGMEQSIDGRKTWLFKAISDKMQAASEYEKLHKKEPDKKDYAAKASYQYAGAAGMWLDTAKLAQEQKERIQNARYALESAENAIKLAGDERDNAHANLLAGRILKFMYFYTWAQNFNKRAQRHYRTALQYYEKIGNFAQTKEAKESLDWLTEKKRYQGPTAATRAKQNC
jgi:hypothetical protein